MRLHFFLISFILTKFPEDHRLIVTSLINCLNCNFFMSKNMYESKYMDHIINNF